jgi:hypothetical protein
MKPDVASAKTVDRGSAAVTRWMATVAAGLLVLSIVWNLARSPTSSILSPRFVMNVGVLISMASLIVTNRRVKKALAVGGLMIVTAAFLVHYL